MSAFNLFENKNIMQMIVGEFPHANFVGWLIVANGSERVFHKHVHITNIDSRLAYEQYAMYKTCQL